MTQGCQHFWSKNDDKWSHAHTSTKGINYEEEENKENDGKVRLLWNPLHDLRSHPTWDSISLEVHNRHSRQAVSIDFLVPENALHPVGKYNLLSGEVLDQLFLKLSRANATISSGNRNKSGWCKLCLCGWLLFQSTSARCNGRNLRSLLVKLDVSVEKKKKKK